MRLMEVIYCILYLQPSKPLGSGCGCVPNLLLSNEYVPSLLLFSHSCGCVLISLLFHHDNSVLKSLLLRCGCGCVQNLLFSGLRL